MRAGHARTAHRGVRTAQVGRVDVHARSSDINHQAGRVHRVARGEASAEVREGGQRIIGTVACRSAGAASLAIRVNQCGDGHHLGISSRETIITTQHVILTK